MRILLTGLLFLLGLSASLRAETLDTIGRPADESLLAAPAARFKIELAGAKDNVKIAPLKDGSIAYIVKRPGPNTDRMLTPEEFARFYYDQQRSRGWVNTIFNVTGPVGIAWVALGLGGQIIFTARMLVQWLASESQRRSVVPESFWWLSLVGASMLLIYFIWRRDIVGILGQATGWIIYVRNLILLGHARKSKGREEVADTA